MGGLCVIALCPRCPPALCPSVLRRPPQEVQGWMAKLTEVSENITLWLEVQATWMYLEAVFAGGDIMKQLPAEAKRFAMIDKQWVKIMTKAGEIKNVVGYCYQNELLATLPYLRDQLDACQRQLSAYLEQKRNAFPRFYFVSDGIAPPPGPRPRLLDPRTRAGRNWGGGSPHRGSGSVGPKTPTPPPPPGVFSTPLYSSVSQCLSIFALLH